MPYYEKPVDAEIEEFLAEQEYSPAVIEAEVANIEKEREQLPTEPNTEKDVEKVLELKERAYALKKKQRADSPVGRLLDASIKALDRDSEHAMKQLPRLLSIKGTGAAQPQINPKAAIYRTAKVSTKPAGDILTPNLNKTLGNPKGQMPIQRANVLESIVGQGSSGSRDLSYILTQGKGLNYTAKLNISEENKQQRTIPRLKTPKLMKLNVGIKRV